jgi:hypothetical protein
MKSVTSNSSIGLLLFLLAISFAGCSGDDLDPITLKDQQESTIYLYLSDYGMNTGSSFLLQGGDGDYSVKSSDAKIVVAEMISPFDLRLLSVGIGEATVTITDNSQNILILNIQVDYQTHNLPRIEELDVTIAGNDLTENEKKAIREKQLARIPVKPGGGYKFIFTDFVNKKGKAIIYTDTFGSDGIETTFEYKEFESPYVPGASSFGYEVMIGNEKRIFFLGMLNFPPPIGSRFALIEDVTQEVQVEFPKAEKVYASQIFPPIIHG